MKTRKLFIILLICIDSAACVRPTVNNYTGLKLNPTKSNDASMLLSFSEQYSNLSIDSQKKELIATNQALVINSNDLLERMKLVMIYGLPGSSSLDTQKAQNILQQLLQEDILSNNQLAFAHLLLDHLNAINKLTKIYKEELRRIDLLEQKNDVLQLKLDSAQQKLDELRNIEKSMGSREIIQKK